MKHLTLKNIGSSLALIAGVAAYGMASAHGDEHHDATSAPKAEEAPTAKMETSTPTTADGIWQSIDQKTVELDKTIQSGALDQVHHHAFAIRDLVAALPEHSQSLSADKLAKVKGNVKYVATLAERLDATGDAKDKVGTQTNFEKLKKVLHGLHAIYSAQSSK